MVEKKLKINKDKCIECGACGLDEKNQKALKEYKQMCPVNAIE